MRLVDYTTRSLFWVELCPPKRRGEVLIPSICDCDLVWKQGPCILESGGSLTHVTSVLTREVTETHTGNHRETPPGGWGRWGRSMHLPAEDARHCRRRSETGRGGEGRAPGPGGVRPGQHRGSDRQPLELQGADALFLATCSCFLATAAPGSQRRCLVRMHFPGETGSRCGPGLRISQVTT